MPYTVRISDDKGRLIGLHTLTGLYFHTIRYISLDEIEIILSDAPFQAIHNRTDEIEIILSDAPFQSIHNRTNEAL